MTNTLLNPSILLAEFISSAEAFAAAVKNLPAPLLDCSQAPGEWSIRQIVHHVTDDADMWSFALKKAIASPGAPVRFEGFPGNERWFAALGFNHRPVDTALDLLLAHHRVMVEVASLDPQAWERCFVALYNDQGQSLGQLNVGQILEMLNHHLGEHLNTIRVVSQQNGF